MIKMTVDEAYVFDYYSILKLKLENRYIPESVIKITESDLVEEIGKEKFETVMSSDEFSDLLAANRLTFDAVDKAKTDDVPASYVDKCNYQRMLAKKALQSRFFSSNLTETKIGYDKYSENE